MGVTPGPLEVHRLGPRSWVVFHRALSIQVAWPVWRSRAEADRFRHGLDGLSGWDRDLTTLRADAVLWSNVGDLIAELVAERDSRRRYDYRIGRAR